MTEEHWKAKGTDLSSSETHQYATDEDPDYEEELESEEDNQEK